MGKHHIWTTEEEVVKNAVALGKMPKQIASLLPHISLPSIQSKAAKFRSKKQKVEPSQETKPSRGKLYILYMITYI
jgi:hypothetical protein